MQLVFDEIFAVGKPAQAHEDSSQPNRMSWDKTRNINTFIISACKILIQSAIIRRISDKERLKITKIYWKDGLANILLLQIKYDQAIKKSGIC